MWECVRLISSDFGPNPPTGSPEKGNTFKLAIFGLCHSYSFNFSTFLEILPTRTDLNGVFRFGSFCFVFGGPGGGFGGPGGGFLFN